MTTAVGLILLICVIMCPVVFQWVHSDLQSAKKLVALEPSDRAPSPGAWAALTFGIGMVWAFTAFVLLWYVAFGYGGTSKSDLIWVYLAIASGPTLYFFIGYRWSKKARNICSKCEEQRDATNLQ